ncbi:hypothetical protein [Rufibacter hautae]|uniref:Uncharacterized protein n=1 Tax=Rufibacter hautae TaxID=2595005 RepID=A0A5B6TBU8_9BACT|nr:hypothetical protein [Rufibacter hautae]KAA3436459.1 hypothetical protein FOA19_18895 [Rufibacter hautae]
MAYLLTVIINHLKDIMTHTYEQALQAVEQVLPALVHEEIEFSEILRGAGVLDPGGRLGLQLQRDLTRKRRIMPTEGGDNLVVVFG